MDQLQTPKRPRLIDDADNSVVKVSSTVAFVHMCVPALYIISQFKKAQLVAIIIVLKIIINNKCMQVIHMRGAKQIHSFHVSTPYKSVVKSLQYKTPSYTASS